ncbi:MRN complex-interacting protein [Heracleum sosnowskyi]|uniref:MRN complex-interacting protein n=1 Tax=Heracleum sosnowskyi TaxID=360622 RepID=A0AAD8H8A9_9APIA|nr:MRN complex-interacting protein [Heracleum sosnowskyi]
MAPIIFIAVQCCQCSTMQVKQRKKSSNKWTCAVCNQKQSVLKVFAQSSMAKDVRKVVQTFNMSRQLADQNQSHVFDEQTLASESPKQVNFDNQNKKRTDWTEYIDPEDEEVDNHKDDDNARSLGNVFDEKFVTELPKAVFKKPKLSDYSSSSAGKRNDNSYRPVFGKRSSSYKQLNSLEKEPTKSGGTIMDRNQRAGMKQATDMFGHSNILKHRLVKDKEEPLHAAAIFAEKELMRRQSWEEAGASTWRNYIGKEDGDNNLAAKAPSKLGQKAGASSKWTDYITEEDDDDNADLMILSQKNHPGQWNDVAFCTTLHDRTAEDDIHPDFH